jgi:hypothetical protein
MWNHFDAMWIEKDAMSNHFDAMWIEKDAMWLEKDAMRNHFDAMWLEKDAMQNGKAIFKLPARGDIIDKKNPLPSKLLLCR